MLFSQIDFTSGKGYKNISLLIIIKAYTDGEYTLTVMVNLSVNFNSSAHVYLKCDR